MSCNHWDLKKPLSGSQSRKITSLPRFTCCHSRLVRRSRSPSALWPRILLMRAKSRAATTLPTPVQSARWATAKDGATATAVGLADNAWTRPRRLRRPRLHRPPRAAAATHVTTVLTKYATMAGLARSGATANLVRTVGIAGRGLLIHRRRRRRHLVTLPFTRCRKVLWLSACPL